MAWLCRDTYPNQHVGITVRALIYRWMDRDAAGVPQVSMHDSSGLLPSQTPFMIAGKLKLLIFLFCIPMHACCSASNLLRELFCIEQRSFASVRKKFS